MRTYDFELTCVTGSQFMSPGETFFKKFTSKTIQEEGDAEDEMMHKMIDYAESRGCYISSIKVFEKISFVAPGYTVLSNINAWFFFKCFEICFRHAFK